MDENESGLCRVTTFTNQSCMVSLNSVTDKLLM